MKPCPFCGAIDYGDYSEKQPEHPRVVNGVIIAGNKMTGWYGWCTDCDATGPASDESAEHAAQLWDQRA